MSYSGKHYSNLFNELNMVCLVCLHYIDKFGLSKVSRLLVGLELEIGTCDNYIIEAYQNG